MSLRFGALPYISCLVAITLLSGCGSDSSADTTSIIGKDDRNTLTSSMLKKRIGTLNYSGSSVCTVFASGKNEITTAIHCLSDANLAAFSVLVNGKVMKISDAHFFVKADVVKLDIDGISDYFQASGFSDSEKSEIGSYALDKKEFVLSSKGSAVSANEEGFIMHTLDTIPGASGSPILQNGKVVGVHIGSVSENNNVKNIAVKFTEIDKVDVASFHLPIMSESWWSGKTDVVLCGTSVGTVSYLTYAMCTAALTTATAACTASAGVGCAPAFGSAAAICGIPIPVLLVAVNKCL